MPALDADLPDELKRKLISKPCYYMANYWQHPSDPERHYDFKTTDGEKKLNYLLDEDSPLHAENWGNINVLLMARGCLKTTSVLGISNWAIDIFPQSDVFVTAPREDQVNKFVERFKDYAKESGLDEHYEKNRLSHQKFQRRITTDGEENIYTNNLFAQTAWGEGDSMRGDHTHIGVFDEFQDVDEGAFSTVLEGIDRELPSVNYFPTIFIIGTPKLANTFFNEIWKKSDQKTWDADEQEWIQQSESDSYSSSDDDSSGFQVKGWHIDQHNSPLHSQEEIEFKRDNYSERKFKNEVEAKFYTPEDELLSERDLKECFDDSIGFVNEPRTDENPITVGVDWGGGEDNKAAHTVIAVGEHIEDEDGNKETVLLDVNFLDSELSKSEELREVEETIIRFDADRVLVDEGYGSTRREALQSGGDGVMNAKGYKDILSGCRFGNISDKQNVKWDSSGEEQFFTVNKSYMIQKTVDEFKTQRVVIPTDDLAFGANGANGTMLLDQLSAPYIDKVETPSGTKKLRIQSDRNDDAIDAITYMLIADRQLGQNGPQITDIVTHDRL